MPVEEALPRIKKRAETRAEEGGRFFEKCIEENYLKLLEAEYETLYKNREDRDKLELNMSFNFLSPLLSFGSVATSHPPPWRMWL